MARSSNGRIEGSLPSNADSTSARASIRLGETLVEDGFYGSTTTGFCTWAAITDRQGWQRRYVALSFAESIINKNESKPFICSLKIKYFRTR